MRQVELVVQVEDDDEADVVFSLLEKTAELINGTVHNQVFVKDIFVADDLGTVSRP